MATRRSLARLENERKDLRQAKGTGEAVKSRFPQPFYYHRSSMPGGMSQKVAHWKWPTPPCCVARSTESKR